MDRARKAVEGFQRAGGGAGKAKEWEWGRDIEKERSRYFPSLSISF